MSLLYRPTTGNLNTTLLKLTLATGAALLLRLQPSSIRAHGFASHLLPPHLPPSLLLPLHPSVSLPLLRLIIPPEWG